MFSTYSKSFRKPSFNIFKSTLILIVILSVSSLVCFGSNGVFFEDPSDPLDGLALAELQNNVILPVVANINAESLAVELRGEKVNGSVDVNISVNITTTSLIPSESNFSLLIYLDTDMDPTSGEVEPVLLLNGIGADYNLGFISNMGEIVFRTVEKYDENSGTWINIGQCVAELGVSSVRVDFMRSQIADPMSVRMMAYIFESVSEDFSIADMIPNIGVPPLEFEFEPIAEILAPMSVDEGSEIVFDGSNSESFETITNYSWDLDGDGVFEISSSDPTVTTVYMDDAEVDVTLRVETLSGLTDNVIHHIIVENVPPENLEIIREGSIFVEEMSTFYGIAIDSGSDVLTYSWDFLDGTIIAGSVVNHSYTHMGEYVITLTVIDDDGGINTEEMVLEILPSPLIPVSISSSKVEASNLTPSEGDLVSFIFSITGEGEEPIPVTLQAYIDDSNQQNPPFAELDVVLNSGLNEYHTPEWESTVGDHIFTYSIEKGELVLYEGIMNFNVNESETAEPDLFPIIMFILGGLGTGIYYYLTKGKTEEKGKKEKEEEKEKDFCEEHPEIVEQEEQACWDAQLELSDSLGSIRDQFNAAKPNWEAYSREVGRLLGEWDTAVAVISSLTDSEKELYEDAAKVQEIAGVVTSATSKGKTAFKKGGEAAMKEVGKDFAKDMAKNIAGEVSQFASDVLSLEEWAKSTIGIGFAKLVTGIDPKKEASELRKEAERICDGLRSWVDGSEAWNQGRRPPDTLQSCLQDASKMYDNIGEAEKAFNDAIANFRCIECKIPEELLKLMDQLSRELEDWMKAFGDMIDQVEQRLKQGLKLFNRKDVYDHPYQYLNKSGRNSTYINRALDSIKESRG